MIELSPVGQVIQEATAQLAPDDEKYGDAHAHLCEAMSKPFEQLGELLLPPDPYPPWGTLFHVDLCPGWALPWLAQAVGAIVPGGTSEDELRVLLKDVMGYHVGRPDALMAAAQRYLTGNKTVFFRERDPTAADPPYTLEAVTLISETPNPELVRQEMMRYKPAGILLVYRTVTGWDYQELTATGPDPYSAVDDTYPTYIKLREGPP